MNAMKQYDPKVILLDVDGTLIEHHGIPNEQSYQTPVILDGVREKLAEWEEKGYRIILLTSRKESERQATVEQMSQLHIEYDLLIMGLNRGERILINDRSSSNKKRARAFNVIRNKGLTNIKI